MQFFYLFSRNYFPFLYNFLHFFMQINSVFSQLRGENAVHKIEMCSINLTSSNILIILKKEVFFN